MRVITLFDLPTGAAEERKAAAKFRKQLLDDGFDMLQYSVYSRLCANRDQATKHMLRVKRFAPTKGSVRIIYLTEQQFTGMFIIVGEKSIQERAISKQQMTFF